MPSTLNTSQKTSHSVWIEINRENLLQNLEVLHTAGQGSEILAVVKANAYGHGLREIAHHLSGKVAYLGVSSLREALELKKLKLDSAIFIFGRLFKKELLSAISNGFTLSVSSYEEAHEINELCSELGVKVNIHVKVDTGMGRLGIAFSKALSALEKMAALEGITLEGIYTHFPTAERDDGFSDRQVNDFHLLIKALDKKGVSFRYRHIANSTGAIKRYHSSFNLIRPGLALYGVYPDTILEGMVSLKPVLSLKSRVLLVKRLKPGESTGYGRDFIADKPTTIAILPVGYSHGYPFSAAKNAQVILNGRKYPLAGRISMDYLTINMGDDCADAGDEVTLIGEEGNLRIRVEDVAQWASTIPYEIVTRLLPNIPRISY